MDFEWDAAKAASNLIKHGVSFEIVYELDWRTALVRPARSGGEERVRALFTQQDGRRHVVVFTVRGAAFRIISVRRAHRKEQGQWEK